MGELMNEQNLWAVLVIGGTLGIFNVITTSIGLERLQGNGKGGVFGSLVSAADGGSSVRFANSIVMATPGAVGADGKARKQRGRKAGGGLETGMPPDAVSINLDTDGTECTRGKLDSDSSRAHVRRGKGKGMRSAPGVRDKGILKKGADDGARRKRERVIERERAHEFEYDRDRDHDQDRDLAYANDRGRARNRERTRERTRELERDRDREKETECEGYRENEGYSERERYDRKKCTSKRKKKKKKKRKKECAEYVSRRFVQV